MRREELEELAELLRWKGMSRSQRLRYALEKQAEECKLAGRDPLKGVDLPEVLEARRQAAIARAQRHRKKRGVQAFGGSSGTGNESREMPPPARQDTPGEAQPQPSYVVAEQFRKAREQPDPFLQRCV